MTTRRGWKVLTTSVNWEETPTVDTTFGMGRRNEVSRHLNTNEHVTSITPQLTNKSPVSSDSRTFVDCVVSAMQQRHALVPRLASVSEVKPPRSLAILLQALVGSRVTIETRGGIVLYGLLDYVDRAMNTTLSDASAGNNCFPMLFLTGRQIVFVHLPDDVDIGRVLDSHVRNRLLARP
jgi:small nuclear ribonucleoprotein (snRNP)-like protein